MDPAAYKIPTVKGIHALYAAIAAVENKTQESSKHEETLFVDLVLNTNVMTVAMDFLSRKNLVKNDYYEHKDILNHIWFTPYEENSSGFKRVFNGELFGEGVFWGLQDWTAFDYQEKSNKTNYLSYATKVVLGKVRRRFVNSNAETTFSIRQHSLNYFFFSVPAREIDPESKLRYTWSQESRGCIVRRSFS